MKTRSNMPLFVLETNNVKTLSNSQIDLLRCGDYLVKKDATGEHAYKVTFKSDTGMCITYHDASVIETQSYDKIDGVWTYNSEDKTENLLDVATKEDIEGGTLDNAKPIYWHGIDMYKSGTNSFQFHILNNSSSPINTLAKIKAWAESISGQVNITGNGIIVINNVVHHLTVIVKGSNNSYGFVIDSASGYTFISGVNLEDYFEIFSDSTNKIN